jgi:TetR/AcrR family transcriptional regulator
MSQAGKKQVLLDAAQKRFAYYGISKVTMDEIAADVGLSKAAIYYYFKTKEEIFKEVIIREIEQFTVEMKEKISARSTAAEKLFTFIQTRFKAVERMQNFKKASIDAGVDFRTHMSDTYAAYRQKERLLIAGIIKEGIGSGEFADVSPRKAAVLLQHLILGLINARSRLLPFTLEAQQEIGQDEENEMLAGLIIKGLQRQKLFR